MNLSKHKTPNWLNTLGDRNPQLLRELRSRFQLRSGLATVGIVLLIQGLILLNFILQLPSTAEDVGKYCIASYATCAETNWGEWWKDILNTITFLLPYILCVPGVYALITDIGQETQRGTLNFLRLSPRSSQNILLGKLLGVPILGYFALALCVPLHVVAMLLAGVSLSFFISFYGTMLAWGLVFFLSAMLVGLIARSSNAGNRPPGGTQGIAFVLLLMLVILPIFNAWNNWTMWRSFNLDDINSELTTWFWMAIDSSVLSHLLVWGGLGIIAGLLWWVLQRAFQNPAATLISKLQSYSIVAYASVVILGFIVSAPSRNSFSTFEAVGMAASASFWGLMMVMGSLATPRQMILDWLLMRRNRALVARSAGASKASLVRRSLRDLLLGEKSPGVIAFGINVLIALGTIALVLPGAKHGSYPALLGLMLTGVMLLNYGLLTQLMLLLATPKRNAWVVGALGVVLIVPIIFTVFPIFNFIAGYFTPGLWILLNMNARWNAIYMGNAVFALIVQVAIAMLQYGVLQDRLRQLAKELPEVYRSQ
jgi:hypothetical protein